MNCNPSVQISFASNSSLDISREELRYLVRRVEAALLRSKPYRKVLSDLDAMPQKTAQHARLHTNEAVKDAIRLTLKEILTYYKVASLPTSDTPFEEELVQTATPKAMPAAIAPKLPDPALPSNAVTVPARYCHRASQGKQAEQLRAIGTQLAEARRELGLTAYDLYLRTYVPLHHIEALEAGRLEVLPEDIYLRGFIRLLGNALGLEGDRLAGSLPLEKTGVKGCFNAREDNAGLATLGKGSLYVGYAVLVASAVGGLSYILSRSPEEFESPRLPSSASNLSASQTLALPLPKVGANIAPPEAF